jgi:hypothetical protein
MQRGNLLPETTSGLMKLIFKAIGLAMGVAAVVLGALGTITPDTQITLLGIGLFALALASF